MLYANAGGILLVCLWVMSALVDLITAAFVGAGQRIEESRWELVLTEIHSLGLPFATCDVRIARPSKVKWDPLMGQMG